uniref:N-terminal methionine N(alpha)-acetyltransferase NatE n=1 Tax=Caenorhabditis tropicalis TaxID=1561998 RepID=A0A1I7U2Y6_9PELO
MSSKRSAASSQPLSSSAATTEAERPVIPNVKRDNSFYDNFIDRAANLQITSDEVKNLVDLPASLRISQIDEQNMNQFKTLVTTHYPTEYTEVIIDHTKEYPTDSALATYDGNPAGFVCCDRRSRNEFMYISSVIVLKENRKHGIAGALIQHAITNIATNMKGKDNEAAIRLFNRFGFVLFDAPLEKDMTRFEGYESYVKPVHKGGAPDYLIAPNKKTKIAIGVEDLRVEKINANNAQSFETLNTAIFGKEYDTKLHQKVMKSPNLSAIVLLDDIPVGSMICEKWETGDLRLLEVITMGVLDEHKESEEDIKKLLLNHAFKIAEDSRDIHLLTYYVKKDYLVTMTQLSQLGFTFWLPIPQFYRLNTHDDVYYIKKTSRMATKKIAADVAEDDDCELLQRGEPFDIEFEIEKFDVQKLDALNHSLVIEDVTQDTVETLKELNIEISPKSNTDELFKDVLKTSNFARLALFDGIPVGFIFAEKRLNIDGSSHWSIVTMGVRADKRMYGIGGEFIKHIHKIAVETENIKFLTAFAKGEYKSASRLLKRNGFDKQKFSEEIEALSGHFFFKSIDN